MELERFFSVVADETRPNPAPAWLKSRRYTRRLTGQVVTSRLISESEPDGRFVCSKRPLT